LLHYVRLQGRRGGHDQGPGQGAGRLRDPGDRPGARDDVHGRPPRTCCPTRSWATCSWRCSASRRSCSRKHVVPALLFLCSPESDFVVGQNWVVDGGDGAAVSIKRGIGRGRGETGPLSSGLGIAGLTAGVPAEGGRILGHGPRGGRPRRRADGDHRARRVPHRHRRRHPADDPTGRWSSSSPTPACRARPSPPQIWSGSCEKGATHRIRGGRAIADALTTRLLFPAGEAAPWPSS